MSTPHEFIQVYVVLRVGDGPVDSDARPEECEIDGKIQPTAGPANVSVKQVVMSAQEAREEVIRLNELNAAKGCKYFWQSTHLFPNGGSHGSRGRQTKE